MQFMTRNRSEGDDLLEKLSALASPQRLRIVAALHNDGRRYVSELARQLGMSRTLLHLHLQKLEGAGLVRSQLALSSDGKALNWFEIVAFDLPLSPQKIAAVAHSISD
jgi:DNA-binding transcriptional ArsR family regulator